MGRRQGDIAPAGLNDGLLALLVTFLAMDTAACFLLEPGGEIACMVRHVVVAQPHHVDVHVDGFHIQADAAVQLSALEHRLHLGKRTTIEAGNLLRIADERCTGKVFKGQQAYELGMAYEGSWAKLTAASGVHRESAFPHGTGRAWRASAAVILDLEQRDRPVEG